MLANIDSVHWMHVLSTTAAPPRYLSMPSISLSKMSTTDAGGIEGCLFSLHVSRSGLCSTTGVNKAVVCYPVCGMMHIKEPLLLIEASGGSGFPLAV